MSDLEYYCEDGSWYTPDDWTIRPDEDVIDGRDAVNRRDQLLAGKGKTWHLKFTAELRELESLIGQAGHNDFTAVHADHWEDYVVDHAESLHGDMDGWPFDCIDWEAAADSLRQDYASITYGGEEYYVR